MGRSYNPCTFHCSLENVELNLASSDTIYLIKNGSIRIPITVSVDSNNEIIHITSNFPFDEFIEYKIVFSSAFRFENGNKFLRSFCIRFRVKDGSAYSPNVIGGDTNYYSPQNRLLFSQLLCIHFDDSVNASEDLTFEVTELPESDTTKPAIRFYTAPKPVNHSNVSIQKRIAGWLPTLIAIICICSVILVIIQIFILDILKLPPFLWNFLNGV